MSNLKTVITLAAVSVTTLFGLLWLLKKKKPPARKKLFSDQDIEKNKDDQTGNRSNDLVKSEAHRDGNNSADGVKVSTNNLDKIVQNLELDDLEINHKLSNGQSASVIDEHISAVIEPTLSSQKVSETSVEQESKTDQLNNEPVIEVISSKTCSSENALPDCITSQIIVSDVTHSTTNDLKKCMQEDIDGNKMNGSESMKPEIGNTVNISPEITCTKPAETAQIKEPVSHNSVIETISDDNTVKKHEHENNRIENNDNAISKEEEPSLMSRSWHEDVEESEKKDTNGYSELTEINSNIMESDKQQSTVTNNHMKDSHSPVKNDCRNFSNDRSSTSPPSKNSSPISRNPKQVKDESLNHSETSSNCDNSSEGSTDSGKGGSVGDSHTPHPDDEKVFEFNIPTDMCGLFIGTKGKTVKQLRDQSGARLRLKNNPYTRDFQICVVEGTEAVINRACKLVKRKFPSITIPGIDSTTVSSTVIMPEIMQLNLPDGVSIDVVVSSIVDAGRIFLQQPTHPSFPSLERLNSFMNQCYHHDGAVPNIPKPIESGVICAAPMLNGWYRAQIMMYYEETDECDIKYVDYGGYSRVSSQCLKQIRSDFMTLPFEAIECYLANVTPLGDETYFSPESGVVLEELTQGKMLQAQVVGKAEDGIPYIHLYQVGANSSGLLVNRELVNRGVVRWLDLLS